jgi:sec-independent protein translocase protein TatB
MANEFRASFDEMARQSELDDLRKEVEAMRQASQAALPQDLGISAQMNSDAEAAYLANWEASHAPSADAAVTAEPVMLPLAEKPAQPAAEPAPAKAPRAAKPKTAASRKPAKTEAVAEAAPKPRARKAAAKAKPGADA